MMAGMEELEVHSKVCREVNSLALLRIREYNNILTVSCAVIFGTLDQGQRRSHHLLESSTSQEIAQFRHLQTSGAADLFSLDLGHRFRYAQH